MKRSHSPLPVVFEPVRPVKKVKAETPVSPFPNFDHPTLEESKDVIRLLHSEFPHIPAYRNDPTTGEFQASPCGGVTDVVEALIETILSQNTSAHNSTAAKRNLDTAFGRNNFAAITQAPYSQVVDAIRTGGLANKKATTIQKLLSSIHAKHGSYSLQHLTGKEYSDEDVMEELVSYEGVGPKTASCVLMFCLERESFPVDTHVFRLSKLLGWVPDKSNRISAQAHLDVRIPGELKYGLHVLMIAHGRRCSGCKSRSRGACSLKTYRMGKKGEDIGGNVHGRANSQGPSGEAGDRSYMLIVNSSDNRNVNRPSFRSSP
ncbi:DNA glycosylase [Thelephora ganbajun]|uniref:DNA glycosylase n=1 Tax=Thelephora ganbajun TaxID=370292 RepID=A0ACB6ZH69_THEGA|nr:DNA glycosylase [Thelephora ganbajun]